MQRSRSLWLIAFLLPASLFANPEKIKLNDIRAGAEGAVVTSWEKLDAASEGVRTNSIFVIGLPETVATGDSWEGILVRDGAHAQSDGLKIPRYLVANSGSVVGGGPPAFDPKNNVFIVKTENGGGSGFRFKVGDKAYFISNEHVFSGFSKLEIYSNEGKRIDLPKMLEVSRDRDLLRFEIEASGGIEVQEQINLGEVATAYGNSLAGNVLTESKGKVLGIGPESIEVSCEIVPGNSGGQVVGKDGKLIGVASFLTRRENFWVKDTRYEKIRKFALRLRPDEVWVSMPLETFQKESKILSDIESSLEEIIEIGMLAGNHDKILRTKISASNPDRRQAQSKVDVAIDGYNRDLPFDKVYHLFFTKLAEACETLISENNEFWKSDWSKRKYERLSDQAKECAAHIRAWRDDVRKTLK